MTANTQRDIQGEIAKAMKFWQASDGTWWSASRRVCVDKRLDKIVDIFTARLEAIAAELPYRPVPKYMKAADSTVTHNAALDEVQALIRHHIKELKGES